MKTKAMVVDDDLTLCELGTEMLEILGIDAHAEQTLKGSVAYFQANHEDIGLVIFDLNLEEATGIDVFQEMMKIDSNFTGVLASGIFVEEDAPKYREMGIKEIILKPYNLNILKDIISKHMNK
jgi:DNA-binding NtrC family response regulator